MAEAVDVTLGFEQITGLTTVKSLASIPFESDGVTRRPCVAIIHVDSLIGGVAGNSVRYMNNGVDPTSDMGFLITPGTIIKTTTSLQSLRFLGIAAPARLNIMYEAFPGPFFA